MAGLDQFPQPQLPQPPAPPKAVLDHHTYKNRLQELAHKSSIPIPAYNTVNEGLGHLPRFRATVHIDGKSYTSPNTFLHRKEAEQDVARIAYEALLEKVNNEGLPPVHEDLVFSKSIMNEFATKMSLEKPVYQTCQLAVDTPSFTSSLLFNNVVYPACVGKNKKEAEQLAARAAIQSLLGNAESEAILAPIIKSKAKLYETLHPKDSTPRLNNVLPVIETAVVDGGNSMEKDRETLPDDTRITSDTPRHEFSVLPAEPGSSTDKVNLPIAFVPAVDGQQFGDNLVSSKKRRKNKRKANKRARTDGNVLPAKPGSSTDKVNLPIAFVPAVDGQQFGDTSVLSKNR